MIKLIRFIKNIYGYYCLSKEEKSQGQTIYERVMK